MPTCPQCGSMHVHTDRGGYRQCYKCDPVWSPDRAASTDSDPRPARSLVEELEKLYDQLCHQHERVVQDANRQNMVSYELRHMDGKYVLADILVAKADVLNALAHLKKGK